MTVNRMKQDSTDLDSSELHLDDSALRGYKSDTDTIANAMRCNTLQSREMKPLGYAGSATSCNRNRLQETFASCGYRIILRLRISMTPLRWSSLISLETASRVEDIIWARS